MGAPPAEKGRIFEALSLSRNKEEKKRTITVGWVLEIKQRAAS
jgi:hypothetical protein